MPGKIIQHVAIVLSLGLSIVLLAEDSSTRVRVAAISFEPVKLDLAGNADKLEQMFRKAAEGGAKIAVAPEGCLEGYIVNEIIAGKFSAEEMDRVAISIESETIKRFQNLAKSLEMCLVFGFAEKIKDDVFNSAVFIDHLGKVCGKYHKMQLAEGYDPHWWFNRLGTQSRAFDTPFGRCGILICNDRWNPALAQIPALDGAQFLVIPSFGSTSKSQDDAVLARGTETHLPIIEANVGVTLIVNADKIEVADRHREGITFGEITIAPKRPTDTVERDLVESEFIQWRSVEMATRLSKTNSRVDPRGSAGAGDFVELRSDPLEVVIGNNKSLARNGVQHNGGYNGIFAVGALDETTSPFVPAYAGMNLEHYFDASPRQASEIFFEPRYSAMSLRRIDENKVELYQPKTKVYQVESWTEFSLAENHVDFNFRCRPHRNDYAGGFLGVFWASYINEPLDKSIYFLSGDSSLQEPLWHQHCTQTHNRDSTITSTQDRLGLEFGSDDTLFANVSPIRYSEPFFYGRVRDRVLIYMFRPGAAVRFAHSPSGGGRTSKGDDTNPAWDFQMIIPQPEIGREYQLEGRLVYKQWLGRGDVLAEVAAYLEDRK
ncbi:MAG: carbon-nitrogen hydrolase family protein [Planctomycetales bacterium]|nr:carbon-nitrogen hydrolase family protein [Planctomycetales bacterium]